MRCAVRVLASTKLGLSVTLQTPNILSILQRPFCSAQLTSNNLILQRLIREPISNTRLILDSDYNHALQSFDFSWPSFVSALNSSSKSKALKALEWKLEKMIKQKEREQELYSELIYLCGECGCLKLAIRVFLAMESNSVKPTDSVFNSMISAALLVGNDTTALSLYEIMERSEEYKPNSRTYNAFISRHAMLGNIQGMQSWAAAKTAAGFVADLQGYEYLILGCIKANSFEIAERYFEEMISSGIVPSLHILDTMINGLCELRDVCRAQEFLQYMLDNRWPVSINVANRLVGLYSNVGRLDIIEEFLQALMISNQSSEVISQVYYGIIRMHVRADRLDDVEYAVGRMLKHGISFNLADDINDIVRAYFRRAAYDRLELFLVHVKGSYQFTSSTYDLLIAGFRNAGLSEKLDSLLKGLSFSVP